MSTNFARGARRPAAAARGLALLALLAGGCGVFAGLPQRTGLSERLAAIPRAGLPLTRSVTISWDRHQIPFIEADTDADLAVGLGVVHAHLRLGQLEILRRAARGELSVMAGPFTVDVDRALRTLDLGRAIAGIEADLSPAARVMAQGFVAGLNAYAATLDELPVDMRVAGLDWEPWTVRDLLLTQRIATVDVNWLEWVRLLQLRRSPEWAALWPRILAAGRASHPSFEPTSLDGRLLEDAFGRSRSGSNAFVVGPARTRSGAALLASDPHLGVLLPNFWLIAGVRSPGYHAVGLQIPGVPAMALGRNEVAAWGGTNMRAPSSDLVRVPSLEGIPTTTQTQALPVRLWFDTHAEIRWTPLGPVVSDLALLGWDEPGALILHWVGHQPSDEFSALLAMNQATSFEGFRAALAPFAVSGQNYLYADREGTIGQVMAAHLPERRSGPRPDFTRGAAESTWPRLLRSTELPFARDPPRGFLASANNRPSTSTLTAGELYPLDDRVRRMETLIEERGPIDLARVRAIQTDVFMASSRDLAARLVRWGRRLEPEFTARASPEGRALWTRLARFDGTYAVDSEGAVAFELLVAALLEETYQARLGDAVFEAFCGLASARAFLVEDVEAALLVDAAAVTERLGRALVKATERAEPDARWGQLHRLDLAHPFANAPIIGGKFKVGEVSVPGSTDTLLKTAHGRVRGEHRTTYGAQSRFVADLSDLDANYFVLLGGQDGWLNSDTFADQVPLFLRGEYVQVPLRPDAARARAVATTVLRP
jgi:penicillin amidase